MDKSKTAFLTFDSFMKNYDPSKNISVKFLSIYEKTSIIGLRKQQIVNGAETYLTDQEKNSMINKYDLDELVHTELKLRKIPFIVSRSMPDGTKEYYRLDDLLIL